MVRSSVALFLLFTLTSVLAAAEPPLELVAGDRVVLLGNTLIEREQRYGYWELLLTSRFPTKNVTFRNLGWSGDTVFGEARAGFGTASDGYQKLKDLVLASKPTVILIAYGTNESFDGEAGVPRFRKGLETLLDTLKATKARLVLLAPLNQEQLPAPLPDVTAVNQRLALYRSTIRTVAEQRTLLFVDVDARLTPGTRTTPLTDNGVHLTAHGYQETAPALAAGLKLPAAARSLELDGAGTVGSAIGATVSDVKREPLRFTVISTVLPVPGTPNTLRIAGLSAGQYVLTIDGVQSAVGTAEQWQKGVPLSAGPEFDQVEKLRRTIVAKNELYFYRWRPQNETYLLGFRKHEQGKNAVEITAFDPLVAEQETAIATLRVPVPHQYQLTAK